MKKEIVISVLSSLLSALVLFITVKSMGLLEKDIKDTQIIEVTDNIVNKKKYRKVIIDAMKEDGRFIPNASEVAKELKTDKAFQKKVKGDRGQKGETGKVKVDFIVVTFDELKAKHPLCKSESNLNTTSCQSAIHQLCDSRGYVGGINQEVNAPNVGIICIGKE